MPRAFFVLSLVAFCAFCFTAGAEDEPGHVEVAVLNAENWDELAPSGKEVDAIFGDVVLRNRHLAAVIAQPLASRHANMTIRNVGGCLIDLTSREHQSDQLGCYYPGRQAPQFRDWSLIRDEDASTTISPNSNVLGRSAVIVVRASSDQQHVVVEVAYRLNADDPYLSVTTRFTNSGQNVLRIDLEDDVRIDGKNEEIAKSPNGVSPVYWVLDGFWRQAYGLRAPGRLIRSNSDERIGTLTYLDADGRGQAELPPGESYEFTRWIACGRTLMHVTAALDRDSGTVYREVTIRALDGLKRGVSYARMEIVHGDESLGVVRANRDGDLTVPLPQGDYLARLLRDETIIDTATFHVGQPDSQTRMIAFGDYSPGTVSVEIADDDGNGIPCKVQFIGLSDVPSPYFGPETASFGVRNVRYSPDGKFIVNLLPGDYRVLASRGPEFDALTTTLAVRKGQNTPLHATLTRNVDSRGWISSDFHSHSSPSGDNTTSPLGRVLNLACEQIEFAPCTEHNRIATYQPFIDRLGIQASISSVPGIELTGNPLPLNHQNVFPLHHHPHTQDGGAPQPDVDVDIQVQRAAAWDEGRRKLIQENHPDIGWLFYDRNGDGVPDEGHATAVSLFDVIEIHPVERVLALGETTSLTTEMVRGNRIFRWLQLLNQGYRIPGVVNTDAHYNFHGSGGLRNWVQCSTDEPVQIDSLEIVEAASEGRLIMSNGPFLQVWASAGDAARSTSDTQHDGARPSSLILQPSTGTQEGGIGTAGGARVTAGQDLRAPDGKVTLDVSVQCPNWLDVDTVFVLVNGRSRPELVYTRKKTPDAFSQETVRFRKTIPLTLTEDAHLVVAAVGMGSKLGEVMGPVTGQQPPAALANPIFVDVDGNGIAPNKDTLGLPLPVKEN